MRKSPAPNRQRILRVFLGSGMTELMLGGVMNVEMDTNKPGISIARRLRGWLIVGIGIVGSALTIADFLSDFMTVVGWGDWLIGHWRIYFQTCWTFIGDSLGRKITQEASRSLSLLFFVSGVALTTLQQERTGREFKELSNRMIQAFGLVLFVLSWSVLWFVINLGTSKTGYSINDYGKYIFILIIVLIYSLVDHKSVALRIYLCFIYFVLASIILRLWMNSLSPNNVNELLLSIMLIFLFFGPMYIEGNTKSLTIRLTAILIGVATIFGLSEVPKQVERLRTSATNIEAR
jgi:hypothetical protein